MKTYIAKHYLRVGARMVSPGEYFDAEYTEAQEEHLIARGALEMAKPVKEEPAKAEPVKAEPEKAEPEKPKRKAKKAEPEPETEPETEDEAEPEPPELDITDAITPAKKPQASRKKG